MNSSNSHFNFAIIYGILAFILFSTNAPGFLFGFCIGAVFSNLVLLVRSLLD